jgi:ribosomal protein S18 acetylase RimI-like enzyme
MQLHLRNDCEDIDWAAVADILATVGMAAYEPREHEWLFRHSQVTVFVFDGDRLIGFGRALTDGRRQAAVYDIAVEPAWQGRGIGAMIMRDILASIEGCNVLLYANPGRESFYQRFGFRVMKTGMARFTDAAEMERRGFIE